jgi:hypothetical protein
MIYYYDSEDFKNTGIYKNFENIHSSSGILKVESYTAYGAYPLSDVSIEVSKMFGNDKVIFFVGKTNDSGIIENIVLPTRKIVDEVNDASDILYTTYDLIAKYPKYNLEKRYDVSIFDGVKVIQPVIFPLNDLIDGDLNEQ